MTAPVVNKVDATRGTTTVSFYNPTKYQGGKQQAPQPTDKGVFLSQTPGMEVYVLSYGGWSNDSTAKAKAAELMKKLEVRGGGSAGGCGWEDGRAGVGRVRVCQGRFKSTALRYPVPRPTLNPPQIHPDPTPTPAQKAAGEKYDASNWFTAGYDSPMTLGGRHNEVWIPKAGAAAKPTAAAATAKPAAAGRRLLF